MTKLTQDARETIKNHGFTIAGYIRHWYPDGKWHRSATRNEKSAGGSCAA